jgi:hypothetical protein
MPDQSPKTVALLSSALLPILGWVFLYLPAISCPDGPGAVLAAGADPRPFSPRHKSCIPSQNEAGSDDDDDSSNAQDQLIPPDLSWLTSAFPFNTVGIKSALDIRTTITGYLPDANIARTLCDLYFRHASWMCVSL